MMGLPIADLQLPIEVRLVISFELYRQSEIGNRKSHDGLET